MIEAGYAGLIIRIINHTKEFILGNLEFVYVGGCSIVPARATIGYDWPD